MKLFFYTLIATALYLPFQSAHGALTEDIPAIIEEQIEAASEPLSEEFEGTAYAQLKANYEASTRVPTLNDFFYLGEPEAPLCVVVDKETPDRVDITQIVKFTRVEPGHGTVIPPREKHKVVVDPNPNIDRFFDKVVNIKREIYFVAGHNFGEHNAWTALIKLNEANELIFRITGKRGDKTYKKYGLCYYPES